MRAHTRRRAGQVFESRVDEYAELSALWFRREKALSEDQLAEIFTKVYLDGAAAPDARTAVTLPDFSTQEKKKPGARARKAPLWRRTIPPLGALSTRLSDCSRARATLRRARVRSQKSSAFRKLRCITTSKAKRTCCFSFANPRWSGFGATWSRRFGTSRFSGPDANPGLRSY